jgi:predicted glycogen debranching enzyme
MQLLSLKPMALPSYTFSPSSWEDFQAGTRREWLVANGLGGYASSTLIGANTRSYHGLLAASSPTGERQLLLSKVEEEIVVQGTTYQISTNQYRDKIHPNGFQYLALFTQNPFPAWIYNLPGALLKKELFMLYGENTTVLSYELLEAQRPLELYLFILATKRNIHHLLRADSKRFDQSVNEKNVVLTTGNGEPFLYLRVSKGEYYKNGNWYYNFQYVREKERGYDFEEDLFHPGTFAIRLFPGEKIFLAASTSLLTGFEVEVWRNAEERRLKEIAANLPFSDLQAQSLALSADTFLVKDPKLRSIIAGYPWFGDWGRDAFISVPGLLLVTGRKNEAEEFLVERSHWLQGGFLPAFNDPNGGQASYESADTSLWFFYSAYKTWQYGQNKAFIQEIFPTLVSIFEAYRQGKKTWLKMGEDGLIYAHNPETPLTWMDAKVGHWVVTPRSGAPVEVNALWYNALKILAEFSMLVGQYSLKSDCLKLAEKVQASFVEKFWNENLECLYDVVGFNVPDASVRPNQLFALSLPFSLLPKEKEERIFKIIASKLYTPLGLRTLAPDDKNYKGSYQGDRWLRDGAYHQGTVWPWLLGPFMTALVKLKGEKGRQMVLELLSPIFSHLQDAGIGFISEIFWGDFPHYPVGCIAQAWSVAEVLRAYVEEGLGIQPSTF